MQDMSDSELLLKQSDSDIEKTLPKVHQRTTSKIKSPKGVYYHKDLQDEAEEVWGIRETYEKEVLDEKYEKQRYKEDNRAVRQKLENYNRGIIQNRLTHHVVELGFRPRSGRALLTTVGINVLNFILKLCAWLYTGSYSLFSECVHTFANTINLVIFAYGIRKSVHTMYSDCPYYGKTLWRYASFSIYGGGILYICSGLSFYHGVVGIMDPQPPHSYLWAYLVLGEAFVSEFATFLMTSHAIWKDFKAANISLTNGKAIAGVVVAGISIAISQYNGNPVLDAIGSLIIGTIMVGVASSIIFRNVRSVVGRSISRYELELINRALASDIMIRAIHDIKGMEIGCNVIRYKAGVDFNGREVTRSYIEKHGIRLLWKEIQEIRSGDAAHEFLLEHGENIVNTLGEEVDRIKLMLQKRFKTIRHCNLEFCNSMSGCCPARSSSN